MTHLNNGMANINVTARLLSLLLEMPFDKQTKLLKLMDGKAQLKARGHSRKKWKLAVEYSTDDQVMRDYIKDIHSGGVFIETKMPLSVGKELNLKFPLPNYKNLVKIAGKIVWTSEKGIGVKFMGCFSSM